MSAFPLAVEEVAFHGRRASSCCAPSRTQKPHPMALLSQFLAAFGCACERGAHCPMLAPAA